MLRCAETPTCGCEVTGSIGHRFGLFEYVGVSHGKIMSSFCVFIVLNGSLKSGFELVLQESLCFVNQEFTAWM